MESFGFVIPHNTNVYNHEHITANSSKHTEKKHDEIKYATVSQGKKKTELAIGGANVGLGGLVVLGGAFAFASLIAVFAARKKTRRESNKKGCCKKEDEKSQGLRSILQTQSIVHHDPCSAGYGSRRMVESQVDSCKLVPTESLILGENPTPKINGRIENRTNEHQEIILLDDSEQESVASLDDFGGVQECSLPAVDDGPSQYGEENRIKDDSVEDLLLTEVIGIRKEEEEVDGEKMTADAENIIAEETPINLAEEEDDVDDEYSNGEYLPGTEEESSEGTGSTSTESNGEEIWPEESIGASSLELKDTMINGQSAAEKVSEEDSTTKAEECGNVNNGTNILNNDTDNYEATKDLTFFNNEKTLGVAVYDQTARSTRWGVWVCSLLALVFLVLLLFTHHNALSCYIRNDCFVPLGSFTENRKVQ